MWSDAARQASILARRGKARAAPVLQKAGKGVSQVIQAGPRTVGVPKPAKTREGRIAFAKHAFAQALEKDRQNRLSRLDRSTKILDAVSKIPFVGSRVDVGIPETRFHASIGVPVVSDIVEPATGLAHTMRGMTFKRPEETAHGVGSMAGYGVGRVTGGLLSKKVSGPLIGKLESKMTNKFVRHMAKRGIREAEGTVVRLASHATYHHVGGKTLQVAEKRMKGSGR